MASKEEILIYIASRRGLFSKLEASTVSIGKELGISQQSVSRLLQEMEHEGLILREASPKGMSLSISKNGIDLLREKYNLLKTIFEKKSLNSFSGIVTSGLGEGRAYMKMKQYSDQFMEKLGINAYPGTLNIKVGQGIADQLRNTADVIKIGGFSTKERTYGGVLAYRAKINGQIDAAVIFPDRSTHNMRMLEIIAKDYLRGKLGLKDGSKIKIEMVV